MINSSPSLGSENVVPMISIVMPTLNAELYIEEALESIFRQQDITVEVIIVDYNSSDQTSNICRRYAGGDLKFIQFNEAGIPAALNKGFSLARGQFVGWLNADDVFMGVNTLRNLTSALQVSGADYVLSDFATLSAEGLLRRVYHSWPLSARFYSGGNNVFTGSLLFTMATWLQFRGFNRRYELAFEYDLLSFLAKNRGCHVPVCSAGFRQLPASLSVRKSAELAKERSMIVQNSICARLANSALRFLYLCSIAKRFATLGYREQLVGKHWRDL
jgi:glycosyltransferase involved in cell wall biosynthesis